MPFLILLVLIGIPAFEIYLFVAVGGAIGGGLTVVLTFLTAAVGLFLVRAQGVAVMRRAQESVDRGEAPVQEAIDGLCLFMAGVLLIIPGFFTDTIGALLLIPLVRQGIGIALMTKILVVRSGSRSDGSTIEGEFEVVRRPGPNSRNLPDRS